MPTARALSARSRRTIEPGSGGNRRWRATGGGGGPRDGDKRPRRSQRHGAKRGGGRSRRSENDKTGIYALLKADIFNLLCIPPLTIVTAPSTVPNTVVDVPIASTWEKASKLCEDRRALLIVDAPRSWTLNSASADYPAKKVGDFSAIVRKNAALYFPTVRIPDPLQEGGLDDFAPCGIVAGVMSRTDAERGIWKAPAGIDASMRGVVGTSVLGVPVAMNDKENGDFNPLGINCLRSFPNVGHVVWGARTLEGADCWRPIGSTCRCAGSRFFSKRVFTGARSGSCSSPTTNRCGRRYG